MVATTTHRPYRLAPESLLDTPILKSRRLLLRSRFLAARLHSQLYLRASSPCIQAECLESNGVTPRVATNVMFLFVSRLTHWDGTRLSPFRPPVHVALYYRVRRASSVRPVHTAPRSHRLCVPANTHPAKSISQSRHPQTFKHASPTHSFSPILPCSEPHPRPFSRYLTTCADTRPRNESPTLNNEFTSVYRRPSASSVSAS